jgi:hypothetical protein
MADLLMLPETKKGFKYLLVVDDLATDNFDIEPLKRKEPNDVLNALLNMFKRKYISQPEASIRTDGGSEFKGKFHKYLMNNDIMHKVADKGRHKQLGNVENLNKQLGRIFNGYMNKKEEETGKVYKEWTDVLDKVRKMLNEFRKKPEKDPYTTQYAVPTTDKPKYKIGDSVYRISEMARNALNQEQSTPNFRAGDYRWDRVPRKIVKIFYYPKNIRYQLENKPNVSYAEYELKKV